jgi:hypothetical protein
VKKLRARWGKKRQAVSRPMNSFDHSRRFCEELFPDGKSVSNKGKKALDKTLQRL